jgi:phosphoglycerate dehydrogenase-like enzyme
MKILVNVPEAQIRDRFFPENVRKRLEAAGEVVWNPHGRQFTPGELRDSLAGVDIVLTAWGSTKLTDDVMPGAGSLKIIAHTGGSVAGLLCGAGYDRGIKVVSGNELYAETVAEGCVAYFMAALRDIPNMDKRVHSGAWATPNDRFESLIGQTVGIVGLGAISRYLIEFLKPFRCRVKVVSQYTADEELARLGAERATLEDVFSACKIISVHLAQNPSTYRRVSRNLLERMPDGTLFVNTARASCIDGEALVEVLQKNPSIKAVLDVFDEEPLPLGHKLAYMGNVILQPHTVGLARHLPDVTMAVLEDAVGFLNGKPLRYEISREQAAYMTR